jgi:hypothetical protein
MKSSDNTLLLAGLFVLIVVIIALIVYYTRPGETKTPDQTSDDTVLKVENLTFERTLNPDPSAGDGDGVSGYTIEPYGVEYATGSNEYKKLSKNVTFTMNWTNAPGFNAAEVQGFKIDHFVRKPNVATKPTTVEQSSIKTLVTETNTDKDNISIYDFGTCRAKIVSNGNYEVIGQNSFALYAVTQADENTAINWNNTDTQKYTLLYDGRNETDAEATALKVTKEQLSVTLDMTVSETTKFVPKAPEDTSSRTVINKSTYTVSNGNNYSTLAGVYLTTVPETDGKHFYFTFEDGKFLMIAKSDGTLKKSLTETGSDEKFIFEIVDRENNKGKIRQAASRFLNTTARTVAQGPVTITETTLEKDRKYLSTAEESGSLRLYTQKDSNLTENIFKRFTWTFTERIGAALKMPPQTVSGNNTGDVVCISGDYALVGQPGFNGNKGRVIAYTRNASGDWNMQTGSYGAVPPNDGNSGKFGASISIDGDYALIGEPDAGRAYLAKKVKGVWEFSTTATTNPMLKITPTGSSETFGTSVSISGDYMVIGQPGEYRTHLYSRKNISNVKTMQFSIGDFGGSVSISGDTYIVGAKTNGANNHGSVVIYKFNKTTMASVGTNTKIDGIPWKKPTGSDVESNLYFGTSVAIQGEYAFVGAPGFNKNNGRVYVYKLGSDGGWTRANGAARKYYDEKMVNNNTAGSRYIGYGNAGNADDTIEHPQTSIWDKKSTPDIIADMYFGTTLDISGNKLVIGSEKENKVRIYTKNESTVYDGEETGSWNTRKIGPPTIVDGKVVYVSVDKVPIKLIEPPTKQADSKFGASVSIDGDNVIIGEPNKKIGTFTGAGASYITNV